MIDLDDLVVRKFITSLLHIERIVRVLQVVINVLADRAHLLFEPSDVLIVTTALDANILKLLNQFCSYILACQIQLDLGMRQGVTLKHGHSVTDSFTNLCNQATDSSRGIHAQGSGVHDCQ